MGLTSRVSQRRWCHILSPLDSLYSLDLRPRGALAHASAPMWRSPVRAGPRQPSAVGSAGVYADFGVAVGLLAGVSGTVTFVFGVGPAPPVELPRGGAACWNQACNCVG